MDFTHAARKMAELRPDIFTEEKARATLENWVKLTIGTSVASGGFEVYRNNEGIHLVYKIVDWWDDGEIYEWK